MRILLLLCGAALGRAGVFHGGLRGDPVCCMEDYSQIALGGRPSLAEGTLVTSSFLHSFYCIHFYVIFYSFLGFC